MKTKKKTTTTVKIGIRIAKGIEFSCAQLDQRKQNIIIIKVGASGIWRNRGMKRANRKISIVCTKFHNSELMNKHITKNAEHEHTHKHTPYLLYMDFKLHAALDSSSTVLQYSQSTVSTHSICKLLEWINKISFWVCMCVCFVEKAQYAQQSSSLLLLAFVFFGPRISRSRQTEGASHFSATTIVFPVVFTFRLCF